MLKAIIKPALFLLLSATVLLKGYSQNSVLINLGTQGCAETAPGFFLIKDPLTPTPALLTGCGLSAQIPNYNSVFIAYNPKDNKIYLADNRTDTTKIWVLDVGLPENISCPAAISVEPSVKHNYVSNNFEFDNNGDLWSLADYNPATGICSIDKFDATTGNVINSRVLQFPENHYPTSIGNGDLTIAPNGRMFATLGINPSQLYEIKNYNSASAASATYLIDLPKQCFGIAYLNGLLEITGISTEGCYYYIYNISTNTITNSGNFQLGQLPIDNTSFSPALGTTKRILSTAVVNPTTVDIVYEIYVRNMGNTILKNINVIDNLGIAFGAANVSNVKASFTPGENEPGLLINPLFNGTTTTEILAPNQQLNNARAANKDYYFKLQVSCRIANLNKNVTYYNSAIGTAFINNALTPILVSDSSNNGPSTVVDPNNDGNASGINENIPTPFSLGLLPVKFLEVAAVLSTHGSSLLSWMIATPVSNALSFEPQVSSDGITWKTLTEIKISNNNQSAYKYEHQNIPAGDLFYRVKQTDKDGAFIFSKVVLIQQKNKAAAYRVYPSPANDYLYVSLPANSAAKTRFSLYDATGRLVIATTANTATLQIKTQELPFGNYFLKITGNNESSVHKIQVKH